MELASGFAGADDWHNSGGNAGRNGQSTEVGPAAADLLWSGGRTSLIAWQPVIEGNLAIMVRQSAGRPSSPAPRPWWL